MSRLRIRTIALLIAALSFCSVALAQQGTSVDSILSGLKSSDAGLRIGAYDKVKNDQEALKRPEIRKALIDLLERETQALKKMDGPSVEAYGQYVTHLAETASQVADWHDQRQICIIARSPYDPLSQFASDLVTRAGGGLFPCLIQMSQGNFDDRYHAIPVLTHLRDLTGDLDSRVAQQFYDTIVSGLKDSNVLVRQTTVMAMSRYGRDDMIPVLQKIAASDPVSRTGTDGQMIFPVRDAANEAIKAISQRSKSRITTTSNQQ